jgi:hypothetical protein
MFHIRLSLYSYNFIELNSFVNIIFLFECKCILQELASFYIISKIIKDMQTFDPFGTAKRCRGAPLCLPEVGQGLPK